MTPEAADLLRQVARCRRRLRLVSVCQYVMAGAALGLVSAGIATAAASFGTTSALYLVAALLTIGAAAGLVLGWMRTPSLHETATSLDRRLGLKDRAVTAIECIELSDPISTLVLRDANSHVAGVAPARLFPLEMPPYSRYLTFAVVAVGVLAVLRGGQVVTWDRRAGIAVSGPAGGGNEAAAARPRASSRDTGSEVEAGATAASKQLSERRPANGLSAGKDPVSSAREHRPSDARQDVIAASMPPESPSGSDPQSPSAPAKNAGSSSKSQGTADGTGIGRSSRPGSASGGAASGIGSAEGAGGVRSQGMNATGDGRSPAPRFNQPYSERYAAAAIQAEQALRDGRVPLHLRDYVRRYFNGIRAEERR